AADRERRRAAKAHAQRGFERPPAPQAFRPPKDQHAPQLAFPLLVDRSCPLLPATGLLSWCKAEPGCEVPRRAEASGIWHHCNQSTCDERPNAWNSRQPAHGLIRAELRDDLLLQRLDPGVQSCDLFCQLLQRLPCRRGKTAIFLVV